MANTKRRITVNVNNSNIDDKSNVNNSISQNIENPNNLGSNDSPSSTTIDKKNDEIEAKKTAKKLKENMVRIKIPVDSLNPKDLMVPVVINGYQWLIKRGETVTVPEEVARILEEAKYI